MEISKNVFRKRRVIHNTPGHAHALTFSCYKRMPLLRDRTISSFVEKAVSNAMTKHNFHLWAFVFMPEHVHLLIKPNERVYDISAIKKSICQSASRRALNYYKSNAAEMFNLLGTGQKHQKYRFWQDGGGYDRNIFNRNAAMDFVDYVHQNPVQRKLVEKASQWYYSSYNY